MQREEWLGRWNNVRAELSKQFDREVEVIKAGKYSPTGVVGKAIRGPKREMLEAVYGRVLQLLDAYVEKRMTECTDVQFWSTTQGKISSQIWGSHEASWLAFYEFLVSEGVLPEDNKLDPLIELCQNCGWWSPYQNVAVVQHRQTEIHLENNELHNENGPAAAYRDGTKVWVIRGVYVDEQIVMHPETQTLDQIHLDTDEERKRIRIERYGWQRYLREVGAIVRDTRFNKVEGVKESLMFSESTTGRGTALTVLLCACPSTGRVYAMEVGATCRTCEEAQDWLKAGANSLNLPVADQLFAT